MTLARAIAISLPATLTVNIRDLCGCFDSLNDDMDGEELTVWWGHGIAATLENSTPYAATLMECFPSGDTLNGGSPSKHREKEDSSESDEENSDSHENQTLGKSAHTFEVQYLDKDKGSLNLKTLEYHTINSVDPRRNVLRVAWILKTHDSDPIRVKAIQLCHEPPDEKSATAAKAKKKKRTGPAKPKPKNKEPTTEGIKIKSRIIKNKGP